MWPFQSFTFTWWQIAIFKLSLLCLGIVIGAYWHTLFESVLLILLILGVVAALYIQYVAWNQ